MAFRWLAAVPAALALVLVSIAQVSGTEVEELVRALTSEEINVDTLDLLRRDPTVERLFLSGPSTGGELAKVLSSSSRWSDRCKCAYILGEIRCRDSVENLLHSAKSDQSPEVRMVALAALRKKMPFYLSPEQKLIVSEIQVPDDPVSAEFYQFGSLPVLLSADARKEVLHEALIGFGSVNMAPEFAKCREIAVVVSMGEEALSAVVQRYRGATGHFERERLILSALAFAVEYGKKSPELESLFAEAANGTKTFLKLIGLVGLALLSNSDGIAKAMERVAETAEDKGVTGICRELLGKKQTEWWDLAPIMHRMLLAEILVAPYAVRMPDAPVPAGTGVGHESRSRMPFAVAGVLLLFLVAWGGVRFFRKLRRQKARNV